MLSGKTALVTGSTSGIGQGVARAFAAAGAHVVLNGFGDKEVIEAERAALAQQYGVNVMYSAADMAKPAEIAAMVNEAQQMHGSLDIVVNNAGIQHVDRIEDFPPEKWDTVIAINQSSAFHVIKAAIGGMHQHGWGRIINIASAHGKVASVNKSAYVASKHAIVGLTKVVALENADRHITCNAICPGWVLTPLVQQQIEKRAAESGRSFNEEKIALLSEKQPNKEFVSVEEIGALAVFLSGDLARSITGTAISIDGGWTAQ